MLKWQDAGENYSSLELPICRITISDWRKKDRVFDEGAVTSYMITIEDGNFGDGPNFAEKEVPAADMDTLKQQAIAFLREQIQETLAIIDNDLTNSVKHSTRI